MDITPRLVEEGGVVRWRVDLRSRKVFGDDYGQHWLRAPVDNLGAAINEAWRLFDRMRSERERASAQARLNFAGAPTFGEAAKGLLAERLRKEEPEPGARKYIEQYFGLVIRELGTLHFSAFAPPAGDDMLSDYVLKLRADGYKPPSRANRLSVVRQVLAIAWKARWIPAMPQIPTPTVGKELMRVPVYRWQTEADFRRMRDRLLDTARPNTRAFIHRTWRDRGGWDGFVARRRLYMSFGFYTGMHTRDLDELSPERVSPEFGRWERVNSKSAACVPSKPFDMPEPLFRDVETELNRLGRFWHDKEPLAGGPWPTVSKVCASEAIRLSLPLPVGPRIWRRSCAHHLGILGWDEADTADYLGHVDRRMIAEVYRRLPAERSPIKLDWTSANMAKVNGAITARAVVFAFERPPAAVPAAPQRGGLALHTGDRTKR